MPTYEYRCTNGHDFEEFFLKMSAAKSELPCPTCGERGERRMSAGGGLVFKGSGFYITDYGKDGKKTQPTSRPGTSKGDGGSSESAKSESAKSDGAKSDGAKADGAKSGGGRSESAKSDAPKSDTTKSDAKPSSAPSSAPPKGGE
jgi:putative FmdB family regulatory protein